MSDSKYLEDETWDDDPHVIEAASYPMESAGKHYKKDAHRVVCKTCEGTQFTVCVIPGGWWTGIKCEKCGWDHGIHTG